MIQFPHTIADVYVRPVRNIALPSLPGRQVKFLQGHAALKDGRDLAAMLKRPDVKVVLNKRAIDWMPQILKALGAQPVRAELLWPPPDPNPEPEPEPEPEPVAAATRRPNPLWDRSWPRDPKTGRMLPRSARGADGAEPGT